MKLEDKLVHSVIATAVNLHYNEQLKFTPYYNKETKNKGNLFLNHLKKKEKFFDMFQEEQDQSSTDVYNVFYDFIQAICTVEIPDMQNISLMVEAYKKNPKAIEGIVNKILIK